ncbi:MAG: hypothetical protein U5K79_19680 [Cyclobacteriaceae bacterium]|nr:hypothetical protein [Cyclobacteriaceae bacterium]
MAELKDHYREGEGEEPLRITGVVNTGTSEAPVWTPVDRDLTPFEAQRYWGQLGDQSERHFQCMDV